MVTKYTGITGSIIRALVYSLLLACHGPDEAPFLNRFDIPTSDFSTDVRIADLDADGLNDIVVTNFESAMIEILGNTEDAPMLFTPGLQLPVGERPIALAVADLNDDQRPDLVAVNRDASTISVLLNASEGGLAFLRTDFSTGLNPVSVAVGDLNGDHVPDVVVANRGQLEVIGNDATVSVFLNTTSPAAANPTFTAKFDVSTGSATNSIALADLNGDGTLDIAGANLTGQAVVLLNLTPTGSLTPQLTPAIDFNVGSGSGFVVIVDLTGDTLADLVILNPNTSTISVLVNKTVVGSATPEFSLNLDFPTGDVPLSVVVTDVDADGRLDLAVANLGSESVSILRNMLLNTATSPVLESLGEIPTGPEPNSITAGDLNGDGKPDLVTANRSATVSIILAR